MRILSARSSLCSASSSHSAMRSCSSRSSLSLEAISSFSSTISF
ncbi:hypothetical protein [Streptomyces spongiicola]|nr:hypothetical protein [Streptomyces spongiicola]